MRPLRARRTADGFPAMALVCACNRRKMRQISVSEERCSAMAQTLDPLDRRILAELQADSAQSLDDIARKVGSSKTPVWNRIRRMREAGIILRESAILDAEALGLEACFFVLVRTSEHEAEWQRRFLDAVRARPEVLEAHRLAGDIDYILKIRVRNARAYDAFYQALIAQVKIHNVTALLSMEEIKATTALPIPED
jgi:Lrp/AsnC family transcriptional regulator